ncbi:hypothetical protein FA15DRAFT_268049 [Coprinopsis marcescibilis]|uniref:Uncharacterized protein n=1 Tax=Coprinopsis marcescibilis TaxID=230819 RepID=A0A5C3KEB1_COPMA|nr:hypothetical protein FA15DRAFT_268049 [Coprinopsis marcescibilis]
MENETEEDRGTRGDSGRNIQAGSFQNASNLMISGGTFNTVSGGMIATTTNIGTQFVNTFAIGDRDVVPKISGWLTLLNFRTHLSDAHSRSTPGTGAWFIRHLTFEGWVNEECGTLWGRGIPGAGKSTLSAIVIKHLQKRFPDTPILFIFCQIAKQWTVEDLLAALLRQVLERHHERVLPLIKERWENHRMEDTKPSEHELLEWLSESLSQFPKAFISLDALDELLSDRTKSRLLHALVSFRKNLLITSRTLDLLEQCVPDARFVDIRAHREDIQIFFEDRVKHTPVLTRLLAGKESIQNELLSKLDHSSDGMFLRAYLQVEVLTNSTSIANLRKTLDLLPAGVDEMYSNTWKRILGQGEEKALLAKRMVVWLMHGHQSLTIPMLQQALAVDPETGLFDVDNLVDQKLLSSICCGLTSVDEETQVIQLIHNTAYDFFKKVLPEITDTPHSTIAVACVSYLSNCGFEQLRFGDFHDTTSPHSAWYLNKTTPIQCWEQFEEYLAQPDYPLLKYAYNNWGHHAMNCEGPLPPIIATFALDANQYPLKVRTDLHTKSGCHACDIGKPLHVVAKYGLHQLLPKMVITQDATAPRGNTALHLAAMEGYEELVQALLDSGEVDVNSRNRTMQTPLIKAATLGHPAVVQLLLATPDIEIDARQFGGATAFIKAATWGHNSCIALLLPHVHDPNDQDDMGRTVVMKSAYWGHDDMMELLLRDEKVDPNIRDKFG